MIPVRFKLDENLPVEAADLLREADHDAVSVIAENMAGAADGAVSSVCMQERRALFTMDTDFADIRAYPPSEYAGLVVLRLERQEKPHVLDVIRQLLPLIEKEPLAGRLWIVEEGRVRIRE